MRPQPRMQNKKALTVSFALFPVTGLCCHRRLASTAKLDDSVGASEPHDFAVRLTCCSSKAPSASTASRPAFVTIAIRPSVGRDGATNEVICFGEERNYFCKRGWTANSATRPSGKSRRAPKQNPLLPRRCDLTVRANARPMTDTAKRIHGHIRREDGLVRCA